jgi:hypothetical protein
MEAGIQAACGSLRCAEQPAADNFRRRPGEAAMIATLESIIFLLTRFGDQFFD